MKLRAGSLIILIQLTALLLLIDVVNAQTIRSPKRKTNKNETASDLQQHQATALSLLQSLAVDARSYSDEPLRARVQARIADVIWNHDKEAARALFQRAWEIAERLDHAGADSGLPGRGPSNAGRTQSKTSLRREILSLASRCDHVLGEEFLAKLTPRDDADPKTATLE
jgi:hypothetical protein